MSNPAASDYDSAVLRAVATLQDREPHLAPWSVLDVLDEVDKDAHAAANETLVEVTRRLVAAGLLHEWEPEVGETTPDLRVDGITPAGLYALEQAN